MADFTIATTADFDAGTKSQPSPADGNYEVETITDNPGIPDGQLELASIKGDAFNFADSDATTWKWNRTNFSGSPQARILNNRLEFYGGTTFSEILIAARAAFSGNFDIQSKFDKPNSNWEMFCVYGNPSWIYKYDNQNGYLIIWRSNGKTGVYTVVNGSFGALISEAVMFSETTAWFRIVRSGNTFTFYYSLNGSSWTTFTSDVRNLTIPLYPVYDVEETTGGLYYAYDFKVNSGTYDSGAFRTSGNWTSATQTMPPGCKLLNTTITHSGLSATEYIDRIEWLVNGVVKATYETNITSGTSTTITNADLTSGSFDEVNADFAIKIYLVGSGNATPIISQIEGNYIKIANVMFDTESSRITDNTTQVRFL